MKKTKNWLTFNALWLSAFGILPATVIAEEPYESLKSQVTQLEEQLERVKEQLTTQQEQSVTREEVAGLGVSLDRASDWSTPNTLVHLAGYGDAGYTKSYGSGDDGSFRVGSFAPIFHFQYRDLVMLEAEMEVEVESDGETNTVLEYMTIDVFMNDYATLVTGKFLSPIGQFRQNLHPSWINKMASAPPGFGHDGAAPVSDVGIQVRGGLPPIAGVRSSYAIFGSNGPTLESEDGELEGIDAEGLNDDADGDKVYGGRLAVIPVPQLEIGLSRAIGKAAVNKDDGDSIDITLEGERDYDVYGADFSYQFGAMGYGWLQGLGLRGEYVKSKVGATEKGEAASDGATWKTWYTQVAYRIPFTKFESVIRYTDFDSAVESNDQKQWGVGLNYVFTSNFIGKLNYEFNNGVEDSSADSNRFLFQLAYGF
jgi:hypothetical protein